MLNNVIEVKNLSKSFDIASKEQGLKGTVKHFLEDKQKFKGYKKYKF